MKKIDNDKLQKKKNVYQYHRRYAFNILKMSMWSYLITKKNLNENKITL